MFWGGNWGGGGGGMTHGRGGVERGEGGGWEWGNMCVSEALCFSSSHKKQGTVRLEIPSHTWCFSGMLQLLCTYDLRLSQGLTVDEKRASLHDTLTLCWMQEPRCTRGPSHPAVECPRALSLQMQRYVIFSSLDTSVVEFQFFSEKSRLEWWQHQ